MLLFSAPLPFACDPNHELFAIGDVHGMIHLLEDALDEIAKTPRAADKKQILVFTGDLIDRGPKPLECIDAARGARKTARVDEVETLIGNHCQMLASAIGPRPLTIEDYRANKAQKERRDIAASSWIANGGGALFAAHAPTHINDILGEERHDWLFTLKPTFVSGKIAFIHAGLPPGKTVAEIENDTIDIDFRGFREANHWAWVRNPFLLNDVGSNGHDSYFVVHGHTIPSYEPIKDPDAQVARSRINIDGGSFKTKKVRYVHILGGHLELHEVSA